ncbi:uncharacterized protein [Battus philenor]|uniref:uncharacterized protein n=1 Tax=Battus philenor TaxID=42288 RepID=UPI0035D0A1C2
MFVSQDRNVSKRKFQKPNILRKKAKVPVFRPQVTTETNESLDVKSLVTTLEDKQLDLSKVQNRSTKQALDKQKIEKPNHVLNRSAQKVISSSFISEDNPLSTSKRIIRKGKPKDITFALITPKQNDNQNSYVQNGMNVESFLVGGAAKQNCITFDNAELQYESVDNYDNTKWCLDVMHDSHQVTKEFCKGSQEGNMVIEQKLDVVSTMVPLSVVSSMQRKNIITIQEEVMPSMTKMLNNQVDDLSKNTANFKCEVANCNKEFANKQKLKKHQSCHNKEGNTRPPRQTNVECPIKNLRSGVEEPCGRTFALREELLKHLNEEHTLEQANYICGECGRRFFWACGLRAHGRAHGRAHVRGMLACGWPGCGRVFRQPCRLREHTRAHTGDKPYPCKYPNCGWSFRTASKLVRHARRHTGERRHVCTACGRAFLRREHLREHHARQHSPRTRPPHACPHHGCQQSFNNMSSLYMHMKKVHKKEATSTENTVVIDATTIADARMENTFTVSLLKETPVQHSTVAKIEVDENTHLEEVVESEMESEVGTQVVAQVMGEGEVEVAVGGEEHAARTHCTWPLLPRSDCAYENCADAYVLEEDVQVEQSESSENNIYTIRSDLFLHGNVLTNEDSESMGGGVVSTSGGVLGDDLGLLDAHPTIDLMQEELLYTDAVDESSFRVFLLSGEELT